MVVAVNGSLELNGDVFSGNGGASPASHGGVAPVVSNLPAKQGCSDSVDGFSGSIPVKCEPLESITVGN